MLVMRVGLRLGSSLMLRWRVVSRHSEVVCGVDCRVICRVACRVACRRSIGPCLAVLGHLPISVLLQQVKILLVLNQQDTMVFAVVMTELRFSPVTVLSAQRYLITHALT